MDIRILGSRSEICLVNVCEASQIRPRPILSVCFRSFTRAESLTGIQFVFFFYNPVLQSSVLNGALCLYRS